MKKVNSPCKHEFPEIRIKRQILDHYLKGICNFASYYDIFAIEILSPQSNHPTHQIQTDVIDIEFSKVFTGFIKIYNIKNQYSQMTFILSIFIRIEKKHKMSHRLKHPGTQL